MSHHCPYCNARQDSPHKEWCDRERAQDELFGELREQLERIESKVDAMLERLGVEVPS